MWKLDLHFFLIVFFFFSLSDITDLLCQHLNNGSVAIIYFTNTEKFGRSTAASQYFLQMAGFLGIPVIAWNADNSGLERRVSKMNGGLFDAVISTGKCIEGWFISNHCSLFQDKVSFFIIILLTNTS